VCPWKEEAHKASESLSLPRVCRVIYLRAQYENMHAAAAAVDVMFGIVL